MSAIYQLEFEREVREIEQRIAELDAGQTEPVPALGGVDAAEAAGAAPPPPDNRELAELIRRRDRVLAKIYSDLNAWDTVRVARHPDRPQGRDYIDRICRDFSELHGDRRFGDDPAIVTGFGRIGSHKCLVVAHHKGRDTQEKLKCHFGCAHPEGYRKALAKMKLAEKFSLPVVTLVDTPGAFPGIGAEQRGQAEAIAVNLREMSRLRTPVVSAVIGEGGSGGALGLAVADRVGMLQHAWYSVISPEGCAAILWKQANEQTNHAAAEALCLTASDNLSLGVVDDVVPEPLGGAHRDPAAAAEILRKWVIERLDELTAIEPGDLLERRHERFRKFGRCAERVEAAASRLEPDGDPAEADTEDRDPGETDPQRDTTRGGPDRS